MKCRNCKKTLVADDRYCSQCGQGSANLNRPFFGVIKEMLHELLDIDGRLWLTLRTMILKPGQLTYEFNQGKRAKYTPPLRLYLVISILFFLIFSSLYQVYEPSRQLTASASSYYSKAMFVLFPLFALIVQLFFRQSFYIGNLVFSMHIHSVAYLTLMFIAPLEANESTHMLFLLLQIPPSLYLMWYIYSAFKTVFQQTWLKTFCKATAIYLVYMGVLGVVFDVVIEKIL